MAVVTYGAAAVLLFHTPTKYGSDRFRQIFIDHWEKWWDYRREEIPADQRDYVQKTVEKVMGYGIGRNLETAAPLCLDEALARDPSPTQSGWPSLSSLTRLPPKKVSAARFGLLVTWSTLLLPTPPTNIILVLIIAAVAVLACLLLAKPPNLLPPQVAKFARCFPFDYR